jgi:sec-independent protein translocase protein TatA
MGFGISPWEMLVVLVIGVLLFGRNLPSVGKQLGRSLMEFKKGLSDIQSEVNAAAYSEPAKPRAAQRYVAEEYDEPTAPKFEPPTQAPTETGATQSSTA